jgi:hypothetical protein
MAQGELEFAIETISASRNKPDEGDFNNFFNSFFENDDKQNQQTVANPFQVPARVSTSPQSRMNM